MQTFVTPAIYRYRVLANTVSGLLLAAIFWVKSHSKCKISVNLLIMGK